MARRLTALSLLPLLALSFLAPPPLLADTIYFSDGTVERDVEVTSETLKKVYFTKGSIGLERDASDVVRIEYDEWPYAYEEAKRAAEAGEYERALKEIQGAIQFARNDRVRVYATYEKARILEAMGRFDEAVETYRKLVKDFPKHRLFLAAMRGIGDANLRAGRFDEARKAYQAYKEAARNGRLGEHYVYEADLKQAELLAAQGKHAEARRKAERIHEELGDHLKLVSYAAKVLALSEQVAEGDPQGALREIDRFLRKKGIPDAIRARCNMVKGDALRRMGNPQKALEAYLRVVLLYRGERRLQPEALYRAAECFEATDLPDKDAHAEELRNRLRAEYPHSEWAQK